MSNLASNLYFVGSNVGAPGQNSVSYRPPEDSGSLGLLANQQHQAAMTRPQKKEEEQQSSNNFNQNQFKQAPTSTQPTASAPTGSNLVAGGPGTGMAASYASNMGLGGAVSSGGLGTYGGATGLMQGTAAGSGAGWAGLGSASTGLTYGGATGAATTASGAATSGMGLGSASAGMTYGGSAAAGGAASGGAAAGGGAMGGMAAAGPWAALAAVIIANENAQKKSGNRREGTQYYKDLIGGKVFEQDMNKYADKWDKDNKLGLNSDMKTIGNLNTFDFKNAWKNAKKGGILGGLIKKIF